MKKIIALFLTICMLSTTVSALAAVTWEYPEFPMHWHTGTRFFDLTTKYCTPKEGAAISGKSLVLSAGGSAEYGFYLPFYSTKLTITYSGAAGTTTIVTDQQTYTMELTGDGKYELDFAANLGYEPWQYFKGGTSHYYYRQYVEHFGERNYTISSSGGITITKMEFERAKEPATLAAMDKDGFVSPDAEQELFDTLATVAVDLNSPIIVVSGARRYIDHDDVTERPYTYEGKTYLPINTLAKALGYYHEAYSDKNYALMRDMNNEYAWLEGKATVRTTTGDPVEAPTEAIIFRDGEAFAAVRYFAELAGKAVGYDEEGYIFIDNKYTVNDLLNDAKLNSYVKAKFEDFRAERVEGTTYHVAQTSAASDDNNGSSAAPFKTLKKAGEVAQAGDTVIVHAGTYREVLAPKNSGTASSPITFRAAEGEHVVISAADKLQKPVAYKDGIYVTGMEWNMGKGLNQVFIDETSLTEARYPNDPTWSESVSLSSLWPIRGDFYNNVGETDKIYSDTLLNQEDDYWKGAMFVGINGYGFSMSSAEITGSSKGELHVGGTTKNWWGDMNYNWNYGCIYGHMNALDAPGEWVVQDGYLYLIPPKCVNINTVSLSAKRRENVINLNGKKYINIEGMTTIGGSAVMDDSEMCMLNNMNMKYISHYTLSNDQRDGFIDGIGGPIGYTAENPAPVRGAVGNYISGKDNKIVNSVLDHSAGAGIFGGGLYIHIENNLLKDCGYMGSYVGGINLTSEPDEEYDALRGGHVVFNNTVYNVGRACVNISVLESLGHRSAPSLPYEIGYNDFHDADLTSLDTGIIYDYFINTRYNQEKTDYHHNYLYSNAGKKDAQPLGYAMYHDGGSTGTYNYNNIPFNTVLGVENFKTQYASSTSLTKTSSAPADALYYNNKAFDFAIPGGPSGLTYEYFPQEQAFYAGCNPEESGFMLNYEKVKNGQTNMKYSANRATSVSEGVTIENGVAHFTGDDQWIYYDAVDFGAGTNKLNITAYGDKFHTNDEIEIIIGDLENGKAYSMTRLHDAEPATRADNFDVTISMTEGVHPVYVKVKKYKSFSFGGLLPVPRTDLDLKGNTALLNDAYTARVWAGTYTELVQEGSTAVQSARWDGGQGLKNTFPGNIVSYEGINIEKDSNAFVFAAGSGNGYQNAKFNIYMDSLDSEPVVEDAVVAKVEWSDFSPLFVATQKTIPAGEHTFYLKFNEMDSNSYCSDFAWFAFLPSVDDVYSFGYDIQGTKVTVLGGDADLEASTQDAAMPFRKKPISRAFFEQGLVNTKPGSVAVYKNITVGDTKEMNTIGISYAAAEGQADQPIEIRLGSPNSEPIAAFVTKVTGWEDIVTEMITLAEPIAPGTYDMYVSFGGTKGSDQTCKLHKIEFLNDEIVAGE